MNRKLILIVLVSFVFIGSGVYLSFRLHHWLRQARALETRKIEWLALRAALKNQLLGFKGESGIIVKDLSTNWQLIHNPDTLFPSASVVKIPIMLVSFQAAGEGRISLQDTLRLQDFHKVSGSGILKNMKPGAEFTIEELIEIMIAHSDNTATNMLISLLGFDYINSSFERLGLENTNLARQMMDFKNRKNGIENYTTSRDIAYCLEKIYRRDALNGIVSEKCLRLLKQQKINDRIPAQLPDDTEVAHKTGLEHRVCHDAGIIFTPKGDLLICVLTKNGRNTQAAKQFISNIALEAYNYSQRH